MENKPNCDHCGKKECGTCVKKEGKTFCCERCSDDHKEKQEKKIHESANVCKFC